MPSYLQEETKSSSQSHLQIYELSNQQVKTQIDERANRFCE